MARRSSSLQFEDLPGGTSGGPGSKRDMSKSLMSYRKDGYAVFYPTQDQIDKLGNYVKVQLMRESGQVVGSHLKRSSRDESGSIVLRTTVDTERPNYPIPMKRVGRIRIAQDAMRREEVQTEVDAAGLRVWFPDGWTVMETVR